MKIFKERITKHVHVYMSEKHNQILIVPCYYNKAGIIYEQDNITDLTQDITDFELGQNLIKNIDMHIYKDKNLRDSKISDWVTLKFSKSASMTSFYEDYYSIWITELTPENNTLIINASPYKDSDITLYSTISKNRIVDIGNLLKRMFNICKSGQVK